MRHFLGMDGDGNLISTHTFKTARTGLGGFPEDFDLDNPDSESARVAQYKAQLKNKSIVSFAEYNCPCPPSKGVCSCASGARVNMRFDETDGLVAKPDCGFVVDGAPYEPGTVLSRAPGTPLTVKVTGEVPDGTVVTVTQGGVVQLLEQTEASVELTFAGSETPEFTAYAPAQGFTGVLQIQGLYTKPTRLQVRGWQTL